MTQDDLYKAWHSVGADIAGLNFSDFVSYLPAQQRHISYVCPQCYWSLDEQPAQRTWVGLTDEEMRELEKQFNAERVRTSDEEYLVIYPGDYWAWQRAIGAKLKEKNQ